MVSSLMSSSLNLIADWILNLPNKVLMLLFIVGVFSIAALIVYIRRPK